MNFGIIVEGPGDECAYPHIIQKIRANSILVHSPIPAWNKQKLKGKFVGLLKHLDSKRHLQLEKVFVIRDSDCRDPLPLENELLQVFQRSQFNPYFQVHFHATKCELETLLLSDVAAINQVAITRGGVANVQPLNLRLEELVDPKPLFRRTLSRRDYE